MKTPLPNWARRGLYKPAEPAQYVLTRMTEDSFEMELVSTEPVSTKESRHGKPKDPEARKKQMREHARAVRSAKRST